MYAYSLTSVSRPEEFSNLDKVPQHITLYTWPNCTLTELAHHLADSDQSPLPSPAVGARLSFRLIFADTRRSAGAKFTSQDLGSIVLGSEGGSSDDNGASTGGRAFDTSKAGSKTLADAKFIVGDFISVAIQPTGEGATGISPTSGRFPRGLSAGDATSPMGVLPPPRRDNFLSGRDNARGRGRGGPIRGPGGGRNDRRFFDKDRSWEGVPHGEWKRGERLPEPPVRERERGPRR